MATRSDNIQVEPEVKVTKLNKRWHARLFVDGKVYDEMACDVRQDIGWICREMLRWFCKMGGRSAFASAARKRQIRGPWGKIWYKNKL